MLNTHYAHFKDYVMIHVEDFGQLTVAGIPVEVGFLPLTEIIRRLFNQGLKRLIF